ncbi:hypothetical protein [Arthrobacter sp. JCM 19049]
MGLNKDQLICDVLDQYEAHMTFLTTQVEAEGPSLINSNGVSKTDWESDFDTTSLPISTTKEQA